MPTTKSRMSLACLMVTCLFGAFVSAQEVPKYKVDPFWPKELPHNWMIGHIEQIIVDKDEHIWVLHHTNTMAADDMGLAQSPALSECCIPAPQVLVFDTAGNVIKAWGTRGWIPEWPDAVHAFAVDRKGNVWVAGNHAEDRALLKFNSDGKFLMMIGRVEVGPPNNQDTTLLGGPSSLQVDDDANEIYVADGYINKRIVVYDTNTGAFKRGWGAYGMPLSEIDNNKPAAFDPTAPKYDPKAPLPKQFRGPVVALSISVDGLVYVSDRTSNRIQIFTKQGKFIKEFQIAPDSLGEGAPMALAFSRDPKQKYLFVGDGTNNVVRILNRSDFKEVSVFGHRGHNAGQFDYLDALTLDSKSNLYTGEVRYNNRLQKFILENPQPSHRAATGTKGQAKADKTGQ